ncbi:uncharacterized protein LOC131432925 [Malaya genurostris]|uniref:uncharacterized protein LOC131432925 n=1 Tax=Malaya genurostris TaxID=325434 RepID=UPI0026F3D73E|nr:uncharacterized protein LOC131432925 [Malaya genurostris]
MESDMYSKPCIENCDSAEVEATGNCDGSVVSGLKEEEKISMKRPFSASLDDNCSPEVEPQKKLCRYYYLDKCTKEQNCKYMHSEFPCKYYYFGLECHDGASCKLRHGSALEKSMQDALWEHVTTAPANMLQRFPCFPHVLLKKNFEERNDELLQMEQEGLINAEGKVTTVTNEFNDNLSTTLLCEAIKTFNNSCRKEEAFEQLSDLKEHLTQSQIVSLINFGVRTKEDLFMLGTSSLFKLGFEDETIIHIGNMKAAHRRESIYTGSDQNGNENNSLKENADVLGLEMPEKEICTPTNQQALTDQELLNILNDELNVSNASTVTQTDSWDNTIGSISICNSNNSSSLLSFTNDIEDRSPKETIAKTDNVCIGNFLNLGCSLSQLEVLEKDHGIHLAASLSQMNSIDLESPSSRLSQGDSVTGINAFKSESSHAQLMFNSVQKNSVEQKSVERTVEQTQKLNSLLTESNIEWTSQDSDISFDHLKQDSSTTDSANQSYGSDSDSQSVFRMPFKSIIDRYTPAKEINAFNGKFSTIYKLIPIDIPMPNFDRVRQSFVIKPTYSLDPRIQLMFNIGSTELRSLNHGNPNARDPRLHKQVPSPVFNAEIST